MASGPFRRPSAVLAVVLLVALATGAAASLLIGSATAPNAPPARASELILPEGLLVDLLVAFLVGLVAFGIYRRLTGQVSAVPGQFVVTILTVILVAVLLLVAVEVLGGGGITPTGAGPAGPSSNSTSGGAPLPNVTVTNVSRPGPVTSPLLPDLPGWLPFALVVSVVLVVAVVALPAFRTYAADRRASRLPRSPVRVETDVVQAVLRKAERELDRGGDPRTVIVQLYGELLGRLGRMVGSVDPETPEEIRTLHLERLGIRPEAATSLTRLFEEARYSSHPLGPESSERARTAVRQALADLDRTPEAA